MSQELNISSSGFPNPMADKKQKDSKAYILQYARAMYNQFGISGPRMFYNDRVKYRKLAKYAIGMQPIDQYKKRMDVWDEDEPGKDTFVNINWDVLNLASKFVNIMTNKITDSGFDVQCIPIDPIALDAKRDIEYKMRAMMDHKSWLDGLGVNLNPEKLGFDPSMLPDHSDELEIFMAMNYKDRFAMNAEMAIRLHFNNNDFDQIRREYNRDAVIFGVQCVETRNDKHGNTKIKRIPPESLIVGNSTSEDFKNVTHGGYIENITFAELRASAGNQLSQDDYEEVLKTLYSDKPSTFDYLNGGWDISYSGHQEQMVTVMKFYYKTSITNTYVKKQDKRGNNRLYPQGPNTQPKEGQELLKDSYEVVYEGTWILKSDLIYNYGMMNDMEVDPKNPCATRIPLHVICPNMLNGQTVSILYSCIPILDQIQLSWSQYQHMMAQVVPDGHAIDLDAIAEAALGKGGKNFTPKQVMNMYFKKGILPYSGKRMSGKGGNGVPIQPMQNGNYEKAFGMLNNVFVHINLLRQISGMNEGVDASTPAPGALVGTLQIAQQGADEALGYLFKTDKLMVKNVAESLIRLTQNAIRNGDIEGYIDSIGLSSVNYWKVSKDITAHQFGLQIVTRPTKADWMAFYDRIAQAYAKGLITATDLTALEEITNLKQARQYLAMTERRRQKESIQLQQQNIEQQAKLNQENAVATEQMKQQTLQMELALKGGLIEKQNFANIAEIREKYAFEIQLEQMRLGQKADDAQLAARTNVVTTTLKTQAQIMQKEQREEEKEAKEKEAVD